MTEPRRVAATTLANRVAEERGSALGDLVGYSIRFDERFDRSRTKIKYMTEGILVRELLGDPLLSNYVAIMLDEVHERTAQVDIIMGLLKKVLRKRRDLRLVISSATVDAEYIRDFFNSGSVADGGAREKAAVISIAGSSYSVDVHYLTSPCPNYVKCSAETAMKLHQVEPPGDILIFLTGMEEVDECVDLLREHGREQKQSKHGLRLWPLPMYGSLPAHDQLKVFRPASRGHRKVVVATNIAETSITIDGVAYVVDCCFVKTRWYNADSNADTLVVTEVSRASAQQRAGRAGRTRPGQCYRLCTEEQFLRLPANTPPEMQRTDLSQSVLQLLALGVDNLVRFEFPSAPPSKNLIASLEVLYALGAVDDRGRLTDPLGERMSELPIHPTLSKMLLSSGEFGCSREICAVVSMLQVETVFARAAGHSAKARVAWRNFEVAEGDLLTLLNVYNAFKQQEADSARHWCSSNFLKYKALKRADELCQQMFRTLNRFKIPLKSAGDNLRDILKCIVSGLFPNSAYLHMSGSYRTVRGDYPVSVHPTSVLYTVKQPSWVVFVEMTHTNKVYIKDITAIDPTWLEVLAPHYYEKATRRP